MKSVCRILLNQFYTSPKFFKDLILEDDCGNMVHGSIDLVGFNFMKNNQICIFKKSFYFIQNITQAI